MFVQQGARQFEIWTGKPAPIAEMGYVVTKALERRAAQEEAEETKAAKPAQEYSPQIAQGLPQVAWCPRGSGQSLGCAAAGRQYQAGKLRGLYSNVTTR